MPCSTPEADSWLAMRCHLSLHITILSRSETWVLVLGSPQLSLIRHVRRLKPQIHEVTLHRCYRAGSQAPASLTITQAGPGSSPSSTDEFCRWEILTTHSASMFQCSSTILHIGSSGPTGITFPLERRSRWAEPGLKGETERRGGSSPCSSSRLGIWESPHLSLDLGESPHPVS